MIGSSLAVLFIEGLTEPVSILVVLDDWFEPPIVEGISGYQIVFQSLLFWMIGSS